jgi:hypothetical protein
LCGNPAKKIGNGFDSRPVKKKYVSRSAFIFIFGKSVLQMGIGVFGTYTGQSRVVNEDGRGTGTESRDGTKSSRICGKGRRDIRDSVMYRLKTTTS